MKRILVLDFDGTVTDLDVGDAVCERFAAPEWKEIDDRWARREISLPDAQRQMWALLRATREEAVAGARAIGHLRPGFVELLDGARDRGVELWLASGGFDFYIEALIGPWLDRFSRAWWNASRWEGDRVTVEFPHAELACGSCAVCKGRVCDLAKRAGQGEVLFVGDGHSDRCVVGRADRVAAVRGSHLARWMQQHQAPHVEFERLDEILELL